MAQALRSDSQDRFARSEPGPVVDLTAFGIDDSQLVIGNLELALSERQVFAAGQRAHLTRREFEVLRALALCHGHVVARERLYEHVWERPMPHQRDRSVDTHVNHIRRRLRKAAPDWSYIHTHFGHGYRLEPERAGRGPQRGRAR